ncbi:MAG TPA: hypothetical protein VMT52_05655, partial [Planctomycetota bacterium]|nr:hypothetical protein [Planctomycetota bacterium]
ETVKGLVGRGLRRALEVGPGRVLAGLLRGVSRDVEVVAAGTCEGAARHAPAALEAELTVRGDSKDY